MQLCNNITSKAFKYLKGIKKLIQCSNVIDEDFIYLKGIHTLEIESCDNLTEKAFEYLFEDQVSERRLFENQNINLSYRKRIPVLNVIGRKHIKST